MKRFVEWGGAIAILSWLLIASCSNPLEVQEDTTTPVPIEKIDTVLVLDSIFTGDGVCDTLLVLDSVFVGDSVCDTMYVTDSVFVTDTIHLFDTIQVVDTFTVSDTVTVTVTDTVFVGDSVVIDTVVVFDSLVVTDTLVVSDTVLVTDTVAVTDTVVVGDTVIVPDTVLVTDTLVVTDTVIVELPDSTECGSFCTNLGSQNKDIVWMLNNEPGNYRLDFSGVADKNQPAQTLIIKVGGQEYRWKLAVNDEFSVNVQLGADAEVELLFDKPPAYGHKISVCLKVTKL